MIAFYRIETMPKKKLNEMEQRAAQEAVRGTGPSAWGLYY